MIVSTQNMPTHVFQTKESIKWNEVKRKKTWASFFINHNYAYFLFQEMFKEHACWRFYISASWSHEGMQPAMHKLLQNLKILKVNLLAKEL